MNFIELLKKNFSYYPKKNYEFNLSQNNLAQNIYNSTENQSVKKVKIHPNLNINIEYMQSKYNLLINSDVILREFLINVRGKQYNAFLVYIDGMVNSQIMDDFILKPLMLKNRNNMYDNSHNNLISESITNNITIRKIKKFDLSKYLTECLIPQNAIKKVSTFDEVANRY